VSLTGPVDLDTFHLVDTAWPEPLTKTAVFVKLASYLQPENDRPPHKGIHICHVLLIFPVEQQPWKSLAGWMRTAVNPFPRGSWISCSGRLLGVLDRTLLQGPQLIDTSVRIPVVLPDDWESIRQSSLTAHNTTPMRPSTMPTTPRSTGPQGITSWNPFSSPVGSQNSLANKEKNPGTAPEASGSRATEPPATREAPPNSTTTNVEPVLTISSPGRTSFQLAN
jgi:hypothetical protein